MNRRLRVVPGAIFLIAVSLVLAGVPGTSYAQPAPGQGEQAPATPVVIYPTRMDTSPALRSLPALAPEPEDQVREMRRPLRPGREIAQAAAAQPDPVMETSAPVAPALPAPLANFEGGNNVDRILPPDTNGDIGYDPGTGKKYYVQMLNVSIWIWDVTGTPTKIYGPAKNNTLWSGFGGPCQTSNDGDSIVLFDPLAQRWFMSQFALPNFPSGPFYQCIAVSQTADPTGAWYRYQYLISNTELNDYPKFGVWPDGYYMSFNQFTCMLPANCIWAGQGVAVFERDKMLAGQSARIIYFDLYATDPNLGGLLPSDLDGPAPSSGEPNYFVSLTLDNTGTPQNQLQIWNFHVDWSNTGNTTFTKAQTLTTATFNGSVCGLSATNCIPQPGASSPSLDPIDWHLMWRLQYRNFGSYRTLVSNHTVRTGGIGQAGVRWYELRKVGGAWSIYQQGTYAPDSNSRWMGSVATNRSGHMALGYSVSSTSVYPSVRYAGRLPGDPLGQMAQGEASLVAGSGVQLSTSGRWGDYSMMAVDPVDDCTFWYTQQYYATTSDRDWQTRVGAFRIADCPPPTPRVWLPLMVRGQ